MGCAVRGHPFVAVTADSAPGSAILAMLPNPGQRYLNWYLFEDLAKGADEDWLARL